MLNKTRHCAGRLASVLALLAAACAPAPADPTPTIGPALETPRMPQSEMDAAPPLSDMTMGGMLDGATSAIDLAVGSLESLPDGPLVWRAYEVEVDGAQPVRHAHEAAFIYIVTGEHELLVSTGAVRLVEEQGFFIEPGQNHTHSRTGLYWEIVLAEPGAAQSPDLAGTEPVFESEALEGLPTQLAHLHMLLVELPPEDQTLVHNHPGPEFIYVIEGEIEYETATAGTVRLQEGDHRTLPAGAIVQKRNPTSRPARFLALFVLDPEQPFATQGDF
jgi:quercetin dioxygenase-like cupin family protein